MDACTHADTHTQSTHTYLMACRMAMEDHNGVGSTGPVNISEDI